LKKDLITAITVAVIVVIVIFLVMVSGCTSDEPTPVDGKYNKICQNVSGDVVWSNDTCPVCGASDPELKAVTDELESNECQECGYSFYNLKKKIFNNGIVIE
jgi:hypothetical protein